MEEVYARVLEGGGGAGGGGGGARHVAYHLYCWPKASFVVDSKHVFFFFFFGDRQPCRSDLQSD